MGMYNTIDSTSVAIAKRYERNDVLVITLGITFDFKTLSDDWVISTEWDSMLQVRVSEHDIVQVIRNTSEAVSPRFSKFTGQG